MNEELRVDLEEINLKLSVPKPLRDTSTVYANEEQLQEEFIPANDDKTDWIPKFEGPEETLHNVSLRPTVDISNWPEAKLKFAASFAVYCQYKELEGYAPPEVLDINLFEQYYSLVAEDGANKSEVIEALWADHTSQG
jgi:hypothetical protein